MPSARRSVRKEASPNPNLRNGGLTLPLRRFQWINAEILTPLEAGLAARLPHTTPSSAPAPQSLYKSRRSPRWVYLHVGAPGRALESLENSNQSAYPVSIPYTSHASWAPVRKTEQFEA